MASADYLLTELRVALRSLARAPLFTSVALITLVLGIASVTTMASLLYSYVLRPLPYHDADRLVAVDEHRPSGASGIGISPAAAQAIRTGAGSFERIAVYGSSQTRAAVRGEARDLETLFIDSSFVPLFGVRPGLGRPLAADEIAAGAPVVLISHALWSTVFGADSSIVGRLVAFGRDQFTVVGVMPPGFQYPKHTDLWRPLARFDTTANDLFLIGRLAPGSTRRSATRELSVIAGRLAREDPRNFARIVLSVDDIVDREIARAAPILAPFIGATVFVLLIACSNVANLLLVRAAERRAQVAVRSALGASRGRLLLHGFLESAILAAAAGVLGVLVSAGTIRILLRMVDVSRFPGWLVLGLDARLLLLVVGIVAIVTIAVGLTPAREGMRFDLARALKAGGDNGVVNSSVARRARRGIAVQLALSVVLSIGASLLVQTYRHLSTVDVGYQADQIVELSPYFDSQRYPSDTAELQFARAVLDRVRALPGTRHAAMRAYANPRTTATAGQQAPFDERFIADGDTTHVAGGGRSIRPRPRLFAVSDGYFETLGVPVLAGRGITDHDVAGSERVVVVSRRLANLLWPGTNPIGRTLQVGAYGERLSVVGVVGDVRDLQSGRAGISSLPRADAYVAMRQAEANSFSILIRGNTGGVAALQSAAQQVARQIDPDVVTSAFTLARNIEIEMLAVRVAGSAIGALALCGLILSIIGIYGVVAYSIAQRTREIGIRMALGSSARGVVRLVVTRSLRFVGIGLAVGIVLSLLVGWVLRVLLFGVSATDPLTYLTVCILFGGVALVACYLPARRAARVDPVIALRAD